MKAPPPPEPWADSAKAPSFLPHQHPHPALGLKSCEWPQDRWGHPVQ